MSGCGARSAATNAGEEPASATAVEAADASSGAQTNNEAATEGTNALGEAAAATGDSTNNVTAEITAPGILRADRALPPLRPELAEVVKLVESGAGEEVIRAYVSSGAVAYELSLEEIVYLRDIGVPDGVIAAMMRRGAELRAQQADAQTLRTNLVEAVDQLKQAFASANTNQPAEGNAVGNAVESQAGPPPVAEQSTQPPPEAPEQVQQFYSDLAPYGSWYQVPTYGWVWQPSVVVVNRSWVPYSHGGRWLWTDAGWYWCSDYSWGWAPFHYGRWCTYPGIGWCWVPGSVWGPSWVTWRYSDSHVGWAPLPPACGWSTGIGLTWYGRGVSVGFGFGLDASCFTFVPRHAICYRNVGHHAVHGRHAHDAFKRTTVVNNIIKGDNNTIINNGLGYKKVASFVRGEVPKARIESLPGNTTQPVRADRLERSKGGYVVYKPAAVESTGGRPVAIRPEAKPIARANAAAVTGVGAPGSRSTPVRPNLGSRYTDAVPTPNKAVEARGSGYPVNSQIPASWRTQPRSSVNTRSTSVPATSGTLPKPVESRASGTATRPNAANSPGAIIGPSRQTTPVPLSDPSRYLPANRSNPRTQPVAPQNKSATEGRNNINAPLAPAAPNNPVSAPSRSFYNNSTPSAAPTRNQPAVNYNQPAANYNRPAANYTRPAVPAPPKVDYQRSSPAPTISAPRQTISAPTPNISTPRAPVSSPSPAAASPSRGSSGNSRSRQSN